MSAPPDPAGITLVVNLWDADTQAHLWSSRGATTMLEEFLGALDGWTLATIDNADGRIWAGRARIDDNGQLEMRPEYEFLRHILIPGISPAQLSATTLIERITDNEVPTDE